METGGFEESCPVKTCHAQPSPEFLGMRLPVSVAGQNMPAGVAVTAGFFLSWDRLLWD